MRKFICTIFLTLILNSCEKANEKKTEINLLSLYNSRDTLIVNFEIKSLSNTDYREFGACLDTINNPTVGGIKKEFIDEVESGFFSIKILNIPFGRKYYLRVYVGDEGKYVYSNEKEILIATDVPLITLNNISHITGTTAFVNATIISDGGISITNYGICWGKNSNPSILDSHTLGVQHVSIFYHLISNLEIGSTYYIRAFAINSIGTTYSDNYMLTTKNSNTWTKSIDFSGSQRINASSFVLGGTAYIACGHKYISGVFTPLDDLWEFSLETNTWLSKASVGNIPRTGAASFSIGNKGYIGTGYKNNQGSNDLWEYNPTSNEWTQKKDFTGNIRSFAVGFSINEKGYIGLGSNNGTVFKDLWEYDNLTDTWTQKADCPAEYMIYPVAFSVNNKAYILGDSSHTVLVWEYDPTTNLWTRKQNFPGGAGWPLTPLVINNRAFVSTGYISNSRETWEYEYNTDIWMSKAMYSGELRGGTVSFSIHGMGFVGLGYDNTNYFKNFWYLVP